MTRTNAKPAAGHGAGGWAALSRHLDDPARAVSRAAADLTTLSHTHRHLDLAGARRERQLRVAWSALVDGGASVDTIAVDCGFDGASALDAALVGATGITATALRGVRGQAAFRLALPTAFRASDTLAYLGRDPASQSQRVTGTASVSVAVLLEGRPARLDLDLAGTQVHGAVSMRGRPGPRSAALAAGITARVLGLTSATTRFEARAGAEPLVRRLISGRAGLRIPLTARPFDALVWSIIGQQISLPFAYQLLREATRLCGCVCPGGLRTMPVPERLATTALEDLVGRKFSRAKARYLTDQAQAAVNGDLNLESLAVGSAVTAHETLLGQRGIGPWSSNYVMMRGFGFGDCVPVGDAGLRRALRTFFATAEAPDGPAMEALMRPFSPHRSLATFHLWRTTV